MSLRWRRDSLNYRAGWGEGWSVWEGQELASWYLKFYSESCKLLVGKNN